MPQISLIACMAHNRVIGYQNHIPWHLPEDLAFFKKKTQGTTVIMGRNTFHSIGHPLPNRQNIVLTHKPETISPSLTTASSLDHALKISYNNHIFLIGGSQVYHEGLSYAHALYLTILDQEFEGDTFFPKFRHLFTCTEQTAFQTRTLSGAYTVWKPNQ